VNGAVASWDAYEVSVHHMLYDQLGWPPGDEQFVIATAGLALSRGDRERMTQLFFEVFNVRGFYLLDSAVAALYAMGKQQGVVLDVGHSGTDVCHVLDGALLPALSQRVPLGGACIDAQLQAMLAARGVDVSLSAARALKEQVAAVHGSPEAAAAGGHGGYGSATHTLPDGQKVNISPAERCKGFRVRRLWIGGPVWGQAWAAGHRG